MRLREYRACVTLSHIPYNEDPDPNHYRVWRTRKRIRELVIDLFRAYCGGRNPTESWGVDGFMAQAWDKQGNSVEIHQHNGKWALVKYPFVVARGDQPQEAS